MPRYREMPPVSKGEINRCGEYLAHTHRLAREERYNEWWERQRSPETARATQVVDDYRAAHQKPLSLTSVGLRQFVRTSLGETPVVSQRLKRLPRIVRKLANMERSNLARLEDIGGTRAVVATLDDQARLCNHIEHVWNDRIRRRRDYVAAPKETGYRARHFVVERNDLRIEIQVRTVNQQAWANAIEQADSRFNLTLKDGVGPDSMLEYFSAAGAMLFHEEAGLPTPDDIRARYDRASDAVVEEGFYVRRRGA